MRISWVGAVRVLVCLFFLGQFCLECAVKRCICGVAKFSIEKIGCVELQAVARK